MHSFKVVIVAIAVLFACSISVAAQDSTARTRLTHSQQLAVAPMQLRGGMPVIEVKLNGQGPFAFAIDTGAGMQLDIDPAVAEQLKLAHVGKIRTGDPSGQNDRDLDAARIATLEFGGAEFRNVTAIIRPQRITKDYPEIDGILGFALFTDYLLTLDYPAMQVRLAKGSLPAANGSDILPFEIENLIPVIEVAVGKLRMKAHIDSGNFVAGFILPEEIVEQLALLTQPVIVGRARSVSNVIEIKQVQLQGIIQIGSFEYPQATITFPALSDTNIGFKVLKDFVLTFDQKNKRMKFERVRPRATVTDSVTR